MVEEVLIRLGVDQRPVTAALRGVRKEFATFKTDLAGMNPLGFLKGAAGAIGIGLGAAAIAGAVKGAVQYAAAIKDVSEETGMASTTIQAFALKVADTGGDSETAQKALQKLTNTIGDARRGNEQAAGTFDKLGVSLKDAECKAKPVEQVLADVMDQVSAIEDPILQASAAADLFGDKMGIKVVGALKEGSKAFEEFKKAKGAWILSDDEIKILDGAKKKVEGWGNSMKALVGKGVAAAANVLLADPRLAEMANAAPRMTDGDSAEVRAQKAKAAADALLKLEKARRDLRLAEMGERQKLWLFQNEERDLVEQIKNAEEGSAAQIDLKTKRLEKEKDIREQLSKVQKLDDDFAKKKLDDQEKRNKQLEHERQVVEGISKAAAGRNEAAADLKRTKQDRTRFSLQELADLDPYYANRDMASQIWKARDIQDAEARARDMAAAGNFTGAEDLMNKADQVRKGLTALTAGERNPFESMEKNIASQAEAMEELVRKAGAEGLKVDLAMTK